MKYRKTLARIRRWYRTIKGPPPRKHGIIPRDTEILGLPASERSYLHDLSLSLRPARAYYRYVRDFEPWQEDKAVSRNILDASSDPDKAGYKPSPLDHGYFVRYTPSNLEKPNGTFGYAKPDDLELFK